MQHPEEGIIHAWLDGALPADEAARLEAHIASCEACAATVAEARGMIAASSRIVGHLDVVPGGVIPAKAAKQKSWARFAIPTAIAAMLLIGINLAQTNKQTSLAGPAAATRGASDLAVAPTADSTAAKVPAPRAESAPASISERRATAGGGAASQRERAMDASVALPPATSVQKSRAPAPLPAPPAAAPITAAPQRAEVQANEARAELSDRVRNRPAQALIGGVAGGAAAAAAPPSVAPTRMSAATADQLLVDTIGFAGCYTMVGVSTTTPATPAPAGGRLAGASRSSSPVIAPPNRFALDDRFERFALVEEPAPTPGLLAVRQLSPAGRPDNVILGAGWLVENGRALLKDGEGKTLLTFTKNGDAIRGVTPSGDRTARVVSCRK